MLEFLKNKPMKLVYILLIILSICTVIKDYYLERFYYMPFDIFWIPVLIYTAKWLGVFGKDD